MEHRYHEIRIEPEHEELLAKHTERICQYYHTSPGELTLTKVEAKTGEHPGVYYKMTVKTPCKQTVSVKIEMPKPQDTL